MRRTRILPSCRTIRSGICGCRSRDAGGAYYFLRVRKRKPDTSGATDLDDYDFPDDEDEAK